jgi:L-ascorbate metabolism protein UlaG (beta-lactamase superfamily)
MVLADNRITYVGHATLLLEMDGVRLLTDPLLRGRVLHLQRRSRAVAEEMYRNIDAVLISHLHWDHLDIASLRLLEQETQLIVPAGAAVLLRKRGFSNIQEIDAGDSISIGTLTIEATPAKHHVNPWLFGSSAPCLGYLVKGSQSIYFPGDTDLFPGMADLVKDLDVALIPVWGWGPNLGAGHMNPARAAEALTLLCPRIAIPIHWGTFYPRGVGWLRSNLLTEPPRLFAQEAAKRMPQVQIHILTPGDALDISKV